MKHLVLLGDSIFDNAGYVDSGDAVIDQLNASLPNGYKASLLAVDGDVVNDVYAQLEQLPTDTSIAFISCGGNDALRIMNVLSKYTETVGTAMELLTEIKNGFQIRYAAMLGAVKEKIPNIVVCTVYDTVPDLEERALTALALYNEVILREAFRIKVPVIDLRLVCNEERDYSPVSPIEPSKFGGTKIVERILGVAKDCDFDSKQSVMFT